METFNTDVIIPNPDGGSYNAVDVLCIYLPDVLIGLEALKAISKGWLKKLAIGVVITSLKTFKQSHCQKTTNP